MTQKERQARSRRAILEAALDEFGAAGYDAVAVEGICSRHGISKGMMYHYYTGKEELFLACADRVFQELHAYLKQETGALEGLPPVEALQRYFLLRETFFSTRPREKHIFENAVVYPPPELGPQLLALRQPIREGNERFLRSLLAHMPLRPGLDREQVIRYLNSIYTVFWSILEQYHPRGNARDLHSLLTEVTELMQMALFGVAVPPGPAAPMGKQGV